MRRGWSQLSLEPRLSDGTARHYLAFVRRLPGLRAVAIRVWFGVCYFDAAGLILGLEVRGDFSVKEQQDLTQISKLVIKRIQMPDHDSITLFSVSPSKSKKRDIATPSPERIPTSHFAQMAPRINENANTTRKASLKAVFSMTIRPVENQMSRSLTTAVRMMPPATVLIFCSAFTFAGL